MVITIEQVITQNKWIPNSFLRTNQSHTYNNYLQLLLDYNYDYSQIIIAFNYKNQK